MSEIENKQGQKPKTCRLALIAFWLALVSVFALLFFVYFVKSPSESYIVLISLYLSFFTFSIGLPLAFVLGIVSVIKIHISKGQLEGKGFGVAGTIISFLLASYFISVLPRIRSISPAMVCGSNLNSLGKAMLIYANDHNGQYPIADKWCDLLIKHTDVTEKQFVCYGALQEGDKGPCHYAMNPNAEFNSPPDLILLFETKGGWNQHGGKEILTKENHHGDGCSFLFNDYHCSFEPFPENLNWGAEQKQ